MVFEDDRNHGHQYEPHPVMHSNTESFVEVISLVLMTFLKSWQREQLPVLKKHENNLFSHTAEVRNKPSRNHRYFSAFPVHIYSVLFNLFCPLCKIILIYDCVRKELCHCNKSSTLCGISRTQLGLHSEDTRLFLFTNTLQDNLVPFLENTSILNNSPHPSPKNTKDRKRQRNNHHFHTHPTHLLSLKKIC